MQKILPGLEVNTVCPIVNYPNDAIITYQRSNAVYFPKNASSEFSSCRPNVYAYLQTYGNVGPCCFNVLTNGQSTFADSN